MWDLAILASTSPALPSKFQLFFKFIYLLLSYEREEVPLIGSCHAMIFPAVLPPARIMTCHGLSLCVQVDMIQTQGLPRQRIATSHCLYHHYWASIFLREPWFFLCCINLAYPGVAEPLRVSNQNLLNIQWYKTLCCHPGQRWVEVVWNLIKNEIKWNVLPISYMCPKWFA